MTRHSPVALVGAQVAAKPGRGHERGIMLDWLQTWGESTAPPVKVMGRMGMSMNLAQMPGLASPAQMGDLATTSGLPQGRLFLELMRSHHVGGVHMADAAAKTAGSDLVCGLAARRSAAQSYEIGIFDELLASTYAA
jgi:uncharacterized protein (DUF305 family)